MKGETDMYVKENVCGSNQMFEYQKWFEKFRKINDLPNKGKKEKKKAQQQQEEQEEQKRETKTDLHFTSHFQHNSKIFTAQDLRKPKRQKKKNNHQQDNHYKHHSQTFAHNHVYIIGWIK